MVRLWGEACGVSVNEIGENLFQFQFQYVDNCLRVQHGSPWLFDNHLLVLNKFVLKKKKFWLALTLTLTLTRHLYYSQWNKLTLLQHKGREGGKGRGENLLYCISLLHSCLQLTNA